MKKKELRKFFTDLITRKKEKRAELEKILDNAESKEEIRGIGEQLKTIRDEISEAEKQLKEIDEDKDDDQNTNSTGADSSETNSDETREQMPNNLEVRGGNIMASYSTGKQMQTRANDDPYDTEDYQKEFMEYVCRNRPIKTEQRADAMSTTADAGAVIPTTILNEIISKLTSYGNIYSRVRKLNVQGGVAIPILSIKPSASWIDEATTSADQKISANDKITFSYYTLECKIAQSLLVNVTTLKMFQDLFVSLAAEAIIKALDIAVLKGTGSGQPLGILNDPRVTNVIEMTDAEIKSWEKWKKLVFAKMPKSYRNGEFFMAQGTFDGYIDGMVDTTGQPIGRVNYGMDGAENYRFGGKNVETVEDDIIAPYTEAAESGAVIAVFADLKDYAINSNLKMQTVKWTDHDKNVIKNKCLLICDGKLVDPNGVVIIKKK